MSVKRAIMVFGNSHTQALKDALASGGAQLNSEFEFGIWWSYKEGAGAVADIKFSAIPKRISNLRSDDLVAVSYAGTHHNIIGLIKHPNSFEVGPTKQLSRGDTLIPENVLKAQFEDFIRAGTMIPKIKAATAARVFHLAPPPPKADEFFIRMKMRRYRGTDIKDVELNSPLLRLRLWQIEMMVLREVCASWGVGLLLPPSAACTSEGFLHPYFYGTDATHANAEYGALILQQLGDLAKAEPKRPLD